MLDAFNLALDIVERAMKRKQRKVVLLMAPSGADEVTDPVIPPCEWIAAAVDGLPRRDSERA